jgi:DNA-binding MarR family transcriptional regulator
VEDALEVSGAQSWRERVRVGLFALLRLADDDPALGRLLVVDALAGGPPVLRRRAEILALLAQIVDQGSSSSRSRSGSAASSALVAEGVVGAVLSVVHARLLESPSAAATTATGPLVGLLNSLTSLIVLPYQGRATATRELSRPLPDVPRARNANPVGGEEESVPRRPLTSHPLQGLEMRLTYRTLRVLGAIAAHPGSSNREVGKEAGIQDQGQISKLLARLVRLGLIENTNKPRSQGERNAWALTPRGAQTERALRTRAPTAVGGRG